MSEIRIVRSDTLRAHVRFDDLIEPVSQALQATSAGLAANGLIVLFPAEQPQLGDVYVKAGVLRGHPIYIVKISPWFALNHIRGQPQGGFIGVFDSQTGHTLALLEDQHYLSDIRTAAAGALAARALAPPRVRVAAVIGAGVQAYWQPQALYRERPFETLVIWARNPQQAYRLAVRLDEALPDVEIQTSDDLEATVRGADAVMTTTSSREPLVRGDWLREGQHITAVGADDPTKCELDATVLRRARVFVDSRDSALTNGDVYRAIEAGAYTNEEIAGELGDVLRGIKPGRLAPSDITVAKLVGLGAQDLVAAEVSLAKLQATWISQRGPVHIAEPG